MTDSRNIMGLSRWCVGFEPFDDYLLLLLFKLPTDLTHSIYLKLESVAAKEIISGILSRCDRLGFSGMRMKG